MTHDEDQDSGRRQYLRLVAISRQELEKLPPDEREIIAKYFQREDLDELAEELTDEAEEMWSGDHEAPVPVDEWPSAHLQAILGTYRDQKREGMLDMRRQMAREVIDGLEPGRRVLLCWRLHTTRQRSVVEILVAAVLRAMDKNLMATTFKEAMTAIIDFEIGLQIDEIDHHYYNGPDAHFPDAADGKGGS